MTARVVPRAKLLVDFNGDWTSGGHQFDDHLRCQNENEWSDVCGRSYNAHQADPRVCTFKHKAGARPGPKLMEVGNGPHFREKPWRSARYLCSVRDQPCLSCGTPFSIHAHHLRHAERTGMGRKASDMWAVPLCSRCHHSCHTRGREADWWSERPKEATQDPIRWARHFHRMFLKAGRGPAGGA